MGKILTLIFLASAISAYSNDSGSVTILMDDYRNLPPEKRSEIIKTISFLEDTEVSVIFLRAVVFESKEKDSLRKTALQYLFKGSHSAGMLALEGLSKMKEPQWRAYSAYMYGEAGDTVGIKPLIKAMDDPDPGVRRDAAGSLGKFKDSAISEHLAGYAGDADFKVRAAVCFSLGQIGDRKGTDALVKRLKDSEMVVRMAGAEALGKIGDTVCIKPLIELAYDREIPVRIATIEALGKLGGVELIKVLRDVKSNDSDNMVRKVAEHAIGGIENKKP